MLSLRTHFDPAEHGGWSRSIDIMQADPVIEVNDFFIAGADNAVLEFGDGVMTIHSRSGDLSYGLCEYDDIRETWIGVRSDVDEDDL